MVTVVVKKHPSGSRKKSKRRRVHPADLKVVEDDNIQTAGKIVIAHNGDDEKPARPSTRKVPRRRNPAAEQAKELAKLDKLFLLAWKETYESRKRRLS